MTGKGKKKKAPANGTSVPNGHAPNGDSAAQPHSAQELKAKALQADTQAQPPARPTNGHQRNGSAAEDALARDAQEEKPASSSSEPEPAAEPEDKEAAGEASGAARPEDVAGPSGRCGEVSIDAAVAESAEALRRLELGGGVRLTPYTGEHELGAIMALISRDLSEPYSIYTYRYFIHNWPHLCFLARAAPEESSGGKGRAVGVVVCKLDVSRRETRRGYVAMLAVDGSERRKGIGSRLVRRAIQAMRNCGCDEVVLETEVTNAASLRLYEALGFVRDKRLFRYYLNGVDAFRLKLWLAPPTLPFQFPFHYP